LGTLGIWVLKLFAMYATDGRTDGRTKATLIAYGREHNNRLTALIQDIMGEPAPELS